jgi:hypothetical protein
MKCNVMKIKSIKSTMKLNLIYVEMKATEKHSQLCRQIPPGAQACEPAAAPAPPSRPLRYQLHAEPSRPAQGFRVLYVQTGFPKFMNTLEFVEQKVNLLII